MYETVEDQDHLCWADSRRPMLEPGPCTEYGSGRLGLCFLHAEEICGPIK